MIDIMRRNQLHPHSPHLLKQTHNHLFRQKESIESEPETHAAVAKGLGFREVGELGEEPVRHEVWIRFEGIPRADPEGGGVAEDGAEAGGGEGGDGGRGCGVVSWEDYRNGGNSLIGR